MTPVVRRVTAPIRVAVRGRDGVGRGTVAAALAGAGVAVTTDPAAADVGVVVIAEVLKPEDRALLDGFSGPAVVVLNKADTTGSGTGGPVVVAHRRAAGYRAVTGVPTVPMIALLADVALDDELIGALRTLRNAPADLSSADAFVAGPHPVSAPVRQRLIATLDRFGIAHAVLALDGGVAAGALSGHMRRLSGLDRVVEQVDAAAAPLHYRRIRTAVIELRALATQSGDDRLTAFLRTDTTVLAVMTAAVHVVEAAGVRVDRGDDAAAHLRRAVHWRRYGRGPVGPLHRACAADITRGSLRLLERDR
ncbi:hypothetical protein [Mycobacterium sp. B14F4]|uniref:hypothetical protein n=1 Tax=Mycobacterium sp. B14F4 TaxID=3153565 RepID=UPI00325FDC53